LAVDTNAIIYAARGEEPIQSRLIAAPSVVVSQMVRVEVLGYADVSREEREALERLTQRRPAMPVDADVADLAIQIRRMLKRRIDMADLCIAATALYFDVPLVTHNRKDFKNIPGLTLIDPLDPDDPNWPA
jgi:predicted nucleic acid-binding protein